MITVKLNEFRSFELDNKQVYALMDTLVDKMLAYGNSNSDPELSVTGYSIYSGLDIEKLHSFAKILTWQSPSNNEESLDEEAEKAVETLDMSDRIDAIEDKVNDLICYHNKLVGYQLGYTIKELETV
jgi:hypothetical protein